MTVDLARADPTPLRRDPGERGCPVCAGAPAQRLHRQRYALFDDSDLPRETQVVACTACGFVFARSHASAAAYRRHYARDSKYAATTQASGSGDGVLDAVRLGALADFLAAQAAPDATILDIGCGRGGLLRALRERARPNVVGIDPSPACVAAVRAIDIAADVGELEAVVWPTDPASFDLIVLSHVLEHVFDVSDVFARVASRVAPGGAVYVEVPDAARYDAEAFPPFYFFDPEHINHFDVDAIAALAARHGWSVDTTWLRRLDLGGGQRYPALGAVLRRAASPPAAAITTAAAAGPTAASAVRRYIERSVAASQEAPPAFTETTFGPSPLVLWGAGSHAQRLLAQTGIGDRTIDCIIDHDRAKQGRHLAGRPVVSPHDGLARAAALGATVVVAIAVGGEAVVERLAVSHPGLLVARA